MNKGIVFFLGLLIGILGCVLLYRFDEKMFNKVSLTKEKEIIITRVDTVFVEAPPKPKKQYTEPKVDTLIIEEAIEILFIDDHDSIYDSEFSFEGREEDDIFSDQLLATRTVKVSLLLPEKQEGKIPDSFFQFFEIQQWSTIVKNKRTYLRNQNMVKIKGMKIDNVNVVFWNDAYFLEIANRYYPIPETEYFEKLYMVNITP
jgi:hypothetical protein